MEETRFALGEHNPQPRNSLSSVLGAAGKVIEALPETFFSAGNQAILDGVLSLVSLYLAFMLRFDYRVPSDAAMAMWTWLLIVPILRPLATQTASGYSGTWRYFNIKDVWPLLGSMGSVSTTLIIFRLAAPEKIVRYAVPRTVIVIDFGFFLILAIGLRMFRRFAFQAARRLGKMRRPAVLIGTADSLATAMAQVEALADTEIIGLLTPETNMTGVRIAGAPLLGTPADLPEILVKHSVELVVVADSSIEGLGEIVETSAEFGVESRLLPSAANVIHGEARYLRRLQPSAAVEREESDSGAHAAVVMSFHDAVVLVTGAGGSIGSELCRQICHLPVRSLLLFDHDENSIFEINRELSRTNPAVELVQIVGNIREVTHLERVFRRYRPNIVLHAAAYKHVPVMEVNCTQAVLNNVVGTRNLVDASIEAGAERFLMISTDKAVRPTSVMGATKRLAETVVQERSLGSGDTRCACVRFGNVVGSRGSVVPIFLKQIEQGGPITITDEAMTRYLMTIPEAVRLVLQAATLGANGEIYMLDMGDPVRIVNLAHRLIEMSGLRPGIDIEIECVGIRPGEKLQEQLWSEDAHVTPTEFSRVLRVSTGGPQNELQEMIRELEQVAQTCDDERVLDLLLAMPIGWQPAAIAAAQNA